MGPEQAAANRKGAKRAVEVSIASQRRKQIIDAARECISEEGVDRLTLRKVAERAHVSHATIAYYFNSRRELIDSALLEISEDFMVGLRQRQLAYGTRDLIDLTHTFLDSDNASARFVVQMIDAGLKDSELRPTHDEFVGYGRERIEKSIRVGMQMGELRDDVDPRIAAALLHTVLIWWQTEIAAEAAPRELALQVGGLVLDLLQRQPSTTRVSSAGGRSSGNGHRIAVDTVPSTIQLIESSLYSDPKLSGKAAGTLAETFRKLYEFAAGASGEESA